MAKNNPDLGFGIALDIDLDKMMKSTKGVTDSMKKITKGFETSKASVKNYADNLMNATRKLGQYSKNMAESFFSKKNLEKVKQGFNTAKDHVSTFIAAIKDAKYELGGLGLIAFDKLHRNLELTRLTTSANTGTNANALEESVLDMSNNMGQFMSTITDAEEVFGRYGHAILNTNSMTSAFGKNTIKTAIMMKEAWGVSFEESISAMNVLFILFKGSKAYGRKFIDTLHDISKASNMSITDLVHLTKQLEHIDAAFKGSFRSDSGAQEYLAMLDQQGGDVQQLINIYKDLQSAVTRGQQSALIATMGGDFNAISKLPIEKIGMEFGRLLEKWKILPGMTKEQIDHANVMKGLIEQQGLSIDMQDALIESYEKGGKLVKKNTDLTKDYATVMATAAKQLEAASVHIQNAAELMTPKADQWKILTGWLNKSTLALLKWFNGLSEFHKKLVVVGLAVFTLRKAIFALVNPLFQIGKFLLPRIIAGFVALDAPVLVITAAFVALGLAVYEVYKHWDELKTAVKEGIDFSKSFVGDVKKSAGDWIIGSYQNAMNWLKSKKKEFSDIIQGPWDGLKMMVARIVESLQLISTGRFGDAKKSISEIFNFSDDKKMANLAAKLSKGVSLNDSDSEALKSNLSFKMRNGLNLTDSEKSAAKILGVKQDNNVDYQFGNSSTQSSSIQSIMEQNVELQKQNTQLLQQILNSQRNSEGHLEDVRDNTAKSSKPITITSPRGQFTAPTLAEGVGVGVPTL